MIGKPELFGNREGITFSGNADQEAVGRRKGIYVKFTAGVLHKIGRKCIDLKLTVMGSGNRADSALMQVVQNCNCKGGTFGRIGSCTQFIKQAQ